MKSVWKNNFNRRRLKIWPWGYDCKYRNSPFVFLCAANESVDSQYEQLAQCYFHHWTISLSHGIEEFSGLVFNITTSRQNTNVARKCKKNTLSSQNQKEFIFRLRKFLLISSIIEYQIKFLIRVNFTKQVKDLTYCNL